MALSDRGERSKPRTVRWPQRRKISAATELSAITHVEHPSTVRQEIGESLPQPLNPMSEDHPVVDPSQERLTIASIEARQEETGEAKLNAENQPGSRGHHDPKGGL
jgi:hypothetical protein